MFRRLQWLALSAVSLLIAGCTGGTETGNPTLQGRLSYSGYSSSKDVAVGDAADVTVVKNAWLSLDGVTVSQSGACDLQTSASFAIPALGVGDHAAGAHNFNAFEAEPGQFCSLELPFTRVRERAGDAPAELVGNSLLLTGNLADGTPYSIASSAAPSLKLMANGSAFELTREEPNVLIVFDFATWLADVDFAMASRDGDSIVISAQSNPALLASFQAALARGVSLYRDANADGVLDSDPSLLARGE